MSAERQMLVEAVDGLLGRAARVPEGDFDAALWTQLAEHGFTLVGVPEGAGGSGGDLADAAAVLQALARAAIDLPVAETAFVAAPLLATAGLPIPAEGPLTVAGTAAPPALTLTRDGDRHHVSGTLRRVAWAAKAAIVATATDDDGGEHVLVVPAPAIVDAAARPNLAGEPRDDLRFDGVLDDGAIAPLTAGAATLLRRGALARAVQMAGALDRVRDLTLAYLPQRRQFGRPLSSFQALQQLGAELVGEVVAATAAVDAAVRAETEGPAPREVAVAKVRAGQAAGVASRLAHQLHGAIGVTEEYELQRLTRRLWAWRDELGAEPYWSRELARVAAAHPDGVWAALTA